MAEYFIRFRDLNLPNRIISSEYMTLEKKQFSTSRNWMVSTRFLSEFEADLLRYYLIVNGPETSDADFLGLVCSSD